MKKVLFSLFVLFSCSQDLTAQVNVSLYIMNTYDDNSFSFYDKRADVYQQSFVAVSKDFEGDYSWSQIYYYGALVLFRTYSSRTYNQHILGGLYTLQLDYRDDEGEDDSEFAFLPPGHGGVEADSYRYGRNAAKPSRSRERERRAEEEQIEVFSDSMVTWLHLKPMLRARFDREEWDFYDFRSGSLHALFRKQLLSEVMGRIQYEIEYKEYPNFNQFTHLEHVGTLSLNRKVAPSTDMFVSMAYGFKDYTSSMYDTTYEATGKGKGKGKGSVKGPKAIVSQFATPSTDQIVLSGGLVRQLGTSTAVTVSWLRRFNPSNAARYIDLPEIFGASEDEIFDDRYGYESNEVSLYFVTRIFSQLPLDAGFQYIVKDYPRAATDLAGAALPENPDRHDQRLVTRVKLLYPLIRSGSGGTLFSLGGEYRFVRNQSNDAYHDYNIHQVSLILSADF